MATTLTGWIGQEIAKGVASAALMTIGGGLVADGYLTHAQLSAVVGFIILVGGGWVALVTAWKAGAAKATVAAVNAHPSITVVPASKATGNKPAILVDGIDPSLRSLTGV